MANPGDPRTSCAEGLTSGRWRWDPSRGKFVSMLRSVDTDKESDFQEPLEENFVLHGYLPRGHSLGEYKPDHLLRIPEKGWYLPVTAEIASLLTHPNYGLKAVNDTSEDGSRMPHPPQGVPMMTLSLPVSQGSSAYIQPNPSVRTNTASIRSEHPPPTRPWPNLSAQTPPSSHGFYVSCRLGGGSVSGSFSAEPAPRMTSSEISYNTVNLTPPARARPPVRHHRSLAQLIRHPRSGPS